MASRKGAVNGGKLRWWTLLGPILFALLFLGGDSASADLSSDLTAAESRAATAEAEVAAAREEAEVARADYAAAARRARPVAAAARAAQAEARELRDELLDRQQEAQAEITRLEVSKQQEEEDHDDEVTMGIGVGLALLIAAGIGLGWSRFRASTPIDKLAQIQLGQAVALCLGGGFLVLVVGVALAGGDGFVSVLGNVIATLGLVLPIALLLGRHSVEVERGRAQPLLRRGRLPNWVPRATAALLALFGLVMLTGGIATDDPSTPPVSAPLREEAKDPEEGPKSDQLAEAKEEAAKAGKEAVGPVSRQRVARIDLRRASRALGQAKSRLVKAQADVRRFSRQLAVLVAREEREAERQAEREAEEAEEIEEEELEFVEEESAGCDPNYSPCVPAYPPDVDCAEVGGSVSVIGSDPHGLDADSDGIGCE